MKIYDLIGIGLGPSNLSTAALLKPLENKVEAIFFDNKKEFNWHPGLMFPDAKLQVSILKDLVTMLDPTSEFSFLNYLKEKRKLYIFAAKNGFNTVKRREFEDYLKWVVTKLDNLNFNSTVDEISYEDGFYYVRLDDQIYKCKNILMGAGLTARVPDFCKNFISSTCFHSSQFLKEFNNYSKKNVTIVGGGQSSCEILKFILEQDVDKLPSKINWIIKTHRLNALEETPFANELYTPNYSQFMYSLNNEKKEKLINDQKMTSDGVSEETLNEIYELLYSNDLNDFCEISIFHDSTLLDVKKTNNSYVLNINNKKFIDSEVLILSTGFIYQIPDSIKKLSALFETQDGKFMVDEKYRLVPKTNINGNIFIHNGAKHIRGVADPNLSLLAWRSGIIINTLIGEEYYNVSEERSLIKWGN
jgi:lysine N6-hydroxylase